LRGGDIGQVGRGSVGLQRSGRGGHEVGRGRLEKGGLKGQG
jgi:hypothetical protein